MTDQADALAVELGFTLGEGATEDIAAFKAALLKMRNDNLALTSENERLKGKCEDIERAYEDLRRRFVQSEQDLAHVDADTRHTIAQLHQAEAALARVRECVKAYPSGSIVIVPPTEEGAARFWDAIRILALIAPEGNP